LTVRENCRLVRRLAYPSVAGHVQIDTDDILERLGLNNYADRRACQLSLGNRKKLNLILALLHRPSLLLLDEPFGALDVAIRELLRRELCRYVSGGGAVILASHLLEEVDKIADRVLFLADGQPRGTLPGMNGAAALERRYIELTGGGEPG
jgi:ABC-type multidrug transport system ATPase subunit